MEFDVAGYSKSKLITEIDVLLSKINYCMESDSALHTKLSKEVTEEYVLEKMLRSGFNQVSREVFNKYQETLWWIRQPIRAESCLDFLISYHTEYLQVISNLRGWRENLKKMDGDMITSSFDFLLVLLETLRMEVRIPEEAVDVSERFSKNFVGRSLSVNSQEIYLIKGNVVKSLFFLKDGVIIEDEGDETEAPSVPVEECPSSVFESGFWAFVISSTVATVCFGGFMLWLAH